MYAKKCMLKKYVRVVCYLVWMAFAALRISKIGFTEEIE